MSLVELSTRDPVQHSNASMEADKSGENSLRKCRQEPEIKVSWMQVKRCLSNTNLSPLAVFACLLALSRERHNKESRNLYVLEKEAEEEKEEQERECGDGASSRCVVADV